MNKDGKKLDQYCHISSGGTPSRRQEAFYGGDILWSTIADMEKSNGVVVDTKEKITPEGLASIGNRIFAKNTLLLAMYGSVGKVAITGEEMATNQAILGINPKNEGEIYIPYLKYWLMINKRKIVNKARGGILKNLSAKIVKNLKIDLPLYDEQIKIANFLTQVETLIARREESIKLLDELFKSTFLDMFGDPINNPQNRKEVRLDDVIVFQRGFDLPKSQRNTEGKIPLYGSNGILDYHDEAKFKEGIITGRSGTIGKVYYSHEPFWPLNTTLFGKDIKGNNIIYLTYLLRFFRLERFYQGAGVPTLNRNNIHKEKIYKVDRDEQDKFAAIVQQVEETQAHYQNSLDELNELFGSLSQRAFRGELDLSAMKINEEQIATRKTSQVVDMTKNFTVTSKHTQLNVDEVLMKMFDSQTEVDKELLQGISFEELRKKVFTNLDQGKFEQNFLNEHIEIKKK